MMDKGGKGLDNFWTAEEFEKAEQRRQQEDEAENGPQGAGPKPNGQAAPAGSEPSSASKDDDEIPYPLDALPKLIPQRRRRVCPLRAATTVANGGVGALYSVSRLPGRS